MRKEITTNYLYKLKKKADKNHTHHKIQKNKEIFVLIYCLTHVYNIQPTVAVMYWFYKLLKNLTM